LNNKKTKLSTKDDVDSIMNKLNGDMYLIESVEKKERKRNPALPFTTSSLQQEAARKLNFRAKKTMMLAQQLYEGISIGKEGTVGLITYMRTDSTRVSEVAQKETADYIDGQFGKNFLNIPIKKIKNKLMPRMLTKR